jgi:hypothetical protein
MFPARLDQKRSAIRSNLIADLFWLDYTVSRLSTCPEMTWYFCNQFTPDLPPKMQSYTQRTGIVLLDKY